MLFRNKQVFWYALYDHTATQTDEYGNEVNPHAVYGDPVKAYGNISPAKGEVETRQFGDNDDYDKVIVLGDSATPIDENAVLWIDREPELNLWGQLVTDDSGDYTTPWDYVVKKVGRGLPNFGSAVIAVSKVNVT